MTPLLPRLKAKDVIRVAVRVGFLLDRQSGSHAVLYRDIDRRRVAVPVHSGRDIKLKTLLAIIKDMGLEPEQFRDLL